MTEVPIEVGYRSYIRLLRKKWDIVYHSKDLYFSHANKILEPFYDMNTKAFYGIETNPTRLAIIKFIDQFRDGPGDYEPQSFRDLLKFSINYAKRVKIRKPFRAGRYQESHKSLADANRAQRYQFQEVVPTVRELATTFPYQISIVVEKHPYKEMIGRTWTHFFVASPANFELLKEMQERCIYITWLLQACEQNHDIIVVEPVLLQFYICFILNAFSCCNVALKSFYLLSIMSSCHRAHRWEWNLFTFLGISIAHVFLIASLKAHPLTKYKLPDRFHDTEALNELKYFREFAPTIIHKVKVVFKDEKPLRTLGTLQLINLFVLHYNYSFGVSHWSAYHGTQ